MSNLDLDSVIEDAIQDAAIPEAAPETPDSSDSSSDLDTSQDTPETAEEAPESTTGTVSDIAIKSPASKANEANKAPEDDFEKRFGIPQNGPTGRENRIPYSRVKKIVAKREKELEASFTPKLTELETKAKDYEGKLTQVTSQVAEFEKVMVNDHERFTNMLLSIPGYKEFLEKKFAPSAPATPTQPTAAEVAAIDPSTEMPQPDQKLSDGTMVYSMDGLKSLMAWQQAQTERKVTTGYEAKLKELSERYAPIEQQWQAQQRIQAAIPHVQAQIAEARKWPQFNENEDEIAKVLTADPKLTLESAYRQVVFPKLVSDRNTMREELLKEIKKAPTSTSVSPSGLKPSPTKGGPQSLEDVIKASIDGSGLR